METERSLGQATIDYCFHSNEIQGLEAPLILSEKVLQKVWLKQDFLRENLLTLSNKRVSVINPGRWNLLEGPDFLDATLKIGDKTFIGDIEVHFEEKDWLNHQHNINSRYDKVILHLLLFPPRENRSPALTTQGNSPEVLVLVDYLHQGLEEYALEDALLSLSKRDELELFQQFLQNTPESRRMILHQKAIQRWRQKVAFAKHRLKTQGWEMTCHQMLLEVLGYRRNRAPMSAIATVFGLEKLKNDPKSAKFLFDSQKDNWQLNGLRPANHPLRRLEQYLSLLNRNADWVYDWRDLAKSLKSKSYDNSLDTGTFRKSYKITSLKLAIKESLLKNTISGTRLDTTIIDALLPIASAEFEKDFFGLWFHWYGGDTSELVNAFINHCDILDRTRQPLCNGLNQGALQLFFEHKL